MPLDQKVQRLKAIDRHPICSSDESQEILLLFMVESMHNVPKIPKLSNIYLTTGVS